MQGIQISLTKDHIKDRSSKIAYQRPLTTLLDSPYQKNDYEFSS